MSAGERIRLLYVIKGLGPGGAEQLLVTHLSQHDRARFDVSVCYVVAAKSHLRPRVESTGAQVDCLGGRRTTDPRWVWRLVRYLHDHPADVIHVHSPLVAAVVRAWRSATRGRRPGAGPALIYTEHNRWPRHDRLTRVANRLTYGLDDVQIAVSKDVRDSLPRRRRRRVEVLGHGIDLTAMAAAPATRDDVRRELGADPGDVVVGIVANLRREKRHDLWLDAIALAADEARLRFVSVGQGQLEAEVRTAAQRRGLGERVRFLGYRPDATRIMTGFDIFTLTSDHEGRPVALMEAMALGLPAVVTAAGGVPEMLTNGTEGYIVAPGDAAALAARYRALAHDARGRVEMGTAARKRAAAFSSAHATARLEQLYTEVFDAARESVRGNDTGRAEAGKRDS